MHTFVPPSPRPSQPYPHIYPHSPLQFLPHSITAPTHNHRMPTPMPMPLPIDASTRPTLYTPLNRHHAPHTPPTPLNPRPQSPLPFLPHSITAHMHDHHNCHAYTHANVSTYQCLNCQALHLTHPWAYTMHTSLTAIPLCIHRPYHVPDVPALLNHSLHT